MSGGRPSDYDPAFCEKVVEWGSQGKSRTWIAATLGKHKDTIYAWMKEHQEFSDAMERARLLEQLWWEDAGQTGMFLGGSGFNSAIWNKNMACRFRDEWVESSKVELSGEVRSSPVDPAAAIAAAKRSEEQGEV